MSGGGGGGISSGGSRGGRGSASNCATLKISAKLFSPAPIIISTLKPGDVLKIEYIRPKGPVKVVTPKGDLAGTLLLKEMLEIINCIEQGYEYKVIVQSIAGGNCSVLIKS
jgi:hypothetical protein